MIDQHLSARKLAELLDVSESWCLEHLPSRKWAGTRRFSLPEVYEALKELEEEKGLAEVVRLREVSG